MGARRNQPAMWLMALPVLWGALLVGLFGVNQVFWDEWRIVEMLKAFRDSGIDWVALFSQHNEHRFVLPRIVLMASGVLTGYNTVIQMYVGQGLVLATYLLDLAYLRQVNDQERPGEPAGWRYGAAGLAVGLACYNTKQYENFLMGFQVGFLLVLFFAVAAFYAFARAVNGAGRRWGAWAIVAGVAASLSVLHGLLVWPVGVAAFLGLWFSGGQAPVRRVWPFLACGAVVWALYFIGYQKPAAHPAMLDRGLIPTAGYFFASLGSIAAARYAGLAVPMGVIVFGAVAAAFVYLWRAKRIRDNLFPICLMLYAMAVAAAVALGRAGLKDGVAGAMTSRYASFNLLVYVGLLLVAYREYPRFAAASAGTRWPGKIGLGLLGLWTLGLLVANAFYLVPCREWRDARRANAETTRNYRRAGWAELKTVGPWLDQKQAIASIAILDECKWSVFAPSAASGGKASEEGGHGIR